MKELLSFLFLFQTFLPLSNPQSPMYHRHIVCIDPGHGGDDPGAINQNITEAEENLDIAQKLQSLLKTNGYQVVMTRNDNNVSLTNSQRADTCNSAHTDILISIHLNASDDATTDGTQGLYGTGEESKDEKLTNIIHKTLVSKLNLPDEGITDFGDNVLMKSRMPASLEEVAYITSDDEYQKLTGGTGNRQQQIAQALYDGISTWFERK